MALQTELQTVLEALLGSGNVYFQPPPNVQMSYPCIRYKVSGIDVDRADNIAYRIGTEYEITHIDRNPSSLIPYKLAVMKYSRFKTRFITEGLNHTIFTLYF